MLSVEEAVELKFDWLVSLGGGAGGVASSGLGNAGIDFLWPAALLSSSKMQFSGNDRSSPSTYTCVLNLTFAFRLILGALGFLSRLTRTVDAGRRRG